MVNPSNLTDYCLEIPIVNTEEGIQIPWIHIFIGFRCFTSMIEMVGLFDQYRLLKNKAKCEEIYDNTD